MKYIIYSLMLLTLFSSCNKKDEADLILHNAVIYTIDKEFSTASAFAVKDRKFIAVGNDNEILENFEATNMIDNQGLPVYPGFIDAHAHFYRYGLGLQDVNLTGTKSFEEVIQRVEKHKNAYPEAQWILGRGWDQNDWKIKKFPAKDSLDKFFPDTPVLLTRIDGHAALVNQRALDIAGVNEKTKVEGGLIVVENNQPTGILVDNAIALVSKNVPEANLYQQTAALLKAQENCFKVGLTTVDDAGLDKNIIDLIDSLQKSGKLSMRIYAMLNPTEINKAHYFKNGPYKTDYLNVRSFKIYGDGALGSRGACLLKPYHDDPGNTGFMLNSSETFEQLAAEIYEHDFQMNTHCIGDSANRLLLNVYTDHLKGENDKRWRIEHAQVVANEDLKKFGALDIIPSVQPTHATSDMYWAEDRLGEERIHTAYSFQSLLKENNTIALGSDFPVEDINPLYGFHAAVARQDADNFPAGGFLPEQKLSRKDALKGMTLWAAYANFEEGEKGSIEKGKFADFVILEDDIMKIEENKIRDTKVTATFLAGKKVY